MSIGENLKKIKSEIVNAISKSGRTDSCALIAVSKTKPVAQIREAITAGQAEFGENYVQEALEKINELPKNLRWHFIGALQSNKVRQVVGHFSLIHSVDRLSLAREIAKEAEKKDVRQEILMQINVGDESSKSGVAIEAADELLTELLKLESLNVRGLMCMPPLSEDLAVQRSYFRILKDFMDSRSKKLSDSQRADFTILSMGTTHDFEAAIFEGSTHVRVGTAIFGARA